MVRDTNWSILWIHFTRSSIVASILFSLGVQPAFSKPEKIKELTRTYEFEFTLKDANNTIPNYIEFLKKNSPGLDGLRAQYSMGELLMRRGRYEAAATIFQRLSVVALSDDYFNFSVYHKLADCYMHLGQYRQALQTYGTVREGNIKSLIPEAILGMAVASLALGNKEKSYLHYKELAAFYPIYKTQSHLRLPLGLILWEMHKYEEALNFFLDNDENPASLYFAGISYRETKKPAKAMGLFRRIIREHPRTVWADRAKFELGETFYQEKDFSLALQTFSEIILDHPKDQWNKLALYRLACSDMQVENVKDAEQKLWKLYNTQKKTVLHNNITYLLTESLAEQKKNKRVIDLLRKETKGRIKSPESIYRLVWSLTAEGDYEESIALSNDFLGTSWDAELTPKTLLVQGYAYEMMGSIPESIASYQLVVDHFSKSLYSARSLQLMAMSFYRQQQYAPIITQVNHGWNTIDKEVQQKNPEPLFWIAEAHLKLGNGKEALRFYEEFTDKAPIDHFLMAQAYQGQAIASAVIGNYKDAILVLQRAYETAVETKNAQLSEILSLKLADVSFNSKDYENAATYYRQFEKMNAKHPDRAFALYQGGLALYRSEYYQDAITSWETLAKEFPKNEKSLDALFRAAKTKFDLGQYQEAIKTYGILIRKGSKTDYAKDARLQIAQCYYNAGNFDKAIDSYSDFLKRYPNSPETPQVVDLLQTCYYQAKKSAAEIEKLTKNQPKSAILADIFWEEGAKLYNEKQYEEARKYFQKILFEFPSSSLAPQASFYRAESVFLQEKYAEAIPAYENFIRYYPNDAQRSLAMFHLSVSLFNERDYIKSAESFTRFADEFPGNSTAKDARQNAALSYAKAQKVDEATKAYLTYIAQYPKSEDVGATYLQLGEFLEKAGEEEKAIEAYRRLPGNLPEYFEALYQSGQLYQKLAQTNGEIEVYTQLLKHSNKGDSFRIAGILRLAEIYLGKNEINRAISIYQDVLKNAQDEQSRAYAQEQINALQPNETSVPS